MRLTATAPYCDAKLEEQHSPPGRRSPLLRYWRTPFIEYEYLSPDCELGPDFMKAKRELQQITRDVQDCSIGMVAVRISRCLRMTAGLLHLHIAYLLGVLGSELSSLDYQAEAEMVHRRSLCIGIQVLGDDHLHLASSLDWLAFSLLRQGNHKECVLLCYSSMLITVTHRGVWHLETANCYSNLAIVLEKMGLRDYADKLRAAGRAAFCLAEYPSILPGWKEYNSVTGMSPCQQFNLNSFGIWKGSQVLDHLKMSNPKICEDSSTNLQHDTFTLVCAPAEACSRKLTQEPDPLVSEGVHLLPGLYHIGFVENKGPSLPRQVESMCRTGKTQPAQPSFMVKQKCSLRSEKSEKDFTIGVGRSVSKALEDK